MIERKDEVVMGNCYKVHKNGELLAIVRTELMATRIVHATCIDGNTDPYYYGLAWIEGVRF
jgi:hypothetical protein